MEVKYGALRIFIIYFGSVIGGGLFSWWWYPPDLVVVGASAGAYGLMFLFTADLILNWESIKYKWLTVLLAFCAPVALVIEDILNVDAATWAHVGGCLASIWISLLILPNFYYRKYEWIVPIIAFICFLLQFVLLPIMLSIK